MPLREKTRILEKETLEKTIERLAHEIVEKTKSMDDVAVVGIKTRGACLGERLAARIGALTGKTVAVGALDITLYRDDLTETGAQPVVRATEIDFDINGRRIILVDDVLYTGRTIRSALDALVDYGRPRQIQLAVLVDRGHRELPIRADYVGKNVPTSPRETVEVRLAEIDGRDEVVVCEKEA